MRDRPSDQHRNVASRKMGRALRSDEDVSHNDDNKANNDPSNLTVMAHGEHSRHTGRTKHLRALRKALTMHQRGEKLYTWLLAACVAGLLASSLACTRYPRLTIYDPTHCVDMDDQGRTYPINTHVPVVKRVCH